MIISMNAMVWSKESWIKNDKMGDQDQKPKTH